MAYALVGSVGAVSVGAAAGAVTPAWGAGSSQTANNLLICWVMGGGGASVPGTPAGWSSGASLNGNSLTAAVFYKVAAGADAAPTISGVAATTWSVRLGEFSGNDTASPLDKSGSVTAGATPLNLVTSGVDAAIGELVVYSAGEGLNGGAQTMSNTPTNYTDISVNNNAVATANHYLFGYGFTTANAVADKAAVTFNDLVDNGTGAIASFKLAAGSAPFMGPTFNAIPFMGGH